MSELREAIARAVCRLHIQQVARYDNPPPSEDRIQAGVDNCWEAHLDRADAALAAIEASGYKVEERTEHAIKRLNIPMLPSLRTRQY